MKRKNSNCVGMLCDQGEATSSNLREYSKVCSISGWCFTISMDACWDYFYMSRSLAAHETIYNRTNESCISKQRHHLKMYHVLPLEVIATIRILEFLFIASSQNGSLVI